MFVICSDGAHPYDNFVYAARLRERASVEETLQYITGDP